MSLPWSVNKFFSTSLNASNNITGTFNNVTLSVAGNTELKSDTVINHLGIKKAPNSAYSLDVSGNVNISGTISGGGAHTWTGKQTFTGGIDASASQVINFGTNAPTMSGSNIGYGTVGQTQISGGYVDLSNNQSSIAGAKTFTNTSTFSQVNMTNGFNIQQALVITDNFQALGGSLNINNFNYYDTIVVIPSSTTITYPGPTAFISLPNITSANIGAKFRIMLGGAIIGGSYGFQIYISNYTSTQQVYYNGTKYITLPIDVGYGSPTGFPVGYELVAVNTSQLWAVTDIVWSPNIMLQTTNAWTGFNTFNSSLPTSTLTPSSSTQLITKAYGDATYGILSGTNAWTGTNTFNTNLPTSTKTPTTSTQLITKAYGDATYGILSGTNAWTGTNTFNSSLPTSTLTPSSSTQLITKAYGDATYGILSGTNAWTGTNTFNTNLPTSTLTPSSSTQLITKAYGDATYQATGSYGTLSGANAWTGNTNTFNSYLPTSSLNPSQATTTATQFLTRQVNDARYGQILTGVTNTWASTQIFSVLPTSSDTTTTPVANSLIRKTYADSRYNMLGTYTNTILSNLFVNGDFQLPLYGGDALALVSSSTTDYAPNSSTLIALGFTGWGFSHVGTTAYSAYIQNGTGGTFYLTNYPNSVTQCLVINLPTGTNGSMKCYSATYTGYTAGVYNLSFWVCGGGFYNNSYMTANVYVSGSLVFTSPPINVQGSFPTWQYLNYDLPVSTNTGIYIMFQLYQDPTINNNYYACLQGVQLLGYTGFQFVDSGKTSIVAGSTSLLNALSVNNGLSVQSGGLSSVGSFNLSTSYGTNNIAISNLLGNSSGTNNTNCVAIGSASLGAVTGATNCTVIGSGSCGLPITATPSDLIVIGSNCQTNNQSQSVFIGSQILASSNGGGNNCIGYYIGGGSYGMGGNYNAVIGNQCFSRYNGYQSLNPSYNCAIGDHAQYNNADWYNVSVGANSLLNMAGSNGISYNGGNGTTTQYNSALGHNSGKTYALFNNCTFLGANSDLGSNNLNNATAVGYGTIVNASSTIQLGSNSETVALSGSLKSGSNTITAAQLGYLSAVSTGIVDTASSQTIGGTKTFSTAPVMSGASITSASIPDGALSSNVALLTGTQTFSGTKTFSTAPVMSGASITSATIPNAALQSTVTINNTASTFSALKTFTGGIDASASQTINFGTNPITVGSIVSGGFTVTQAQIGYLSSVSTGIVDTSSNQSITGNKTFSGNVTVNSMILMKDQGTLITAATTAAPLYTSYSVQAGASAFNITLPTITSTNVGQRLLFRRTGGTTTTVVSFIGNGSQNVYNTALTGGTTAQALMGSGLYKVELISGLLTASTYAWFQL